MGYFLLRGIGASCFELLGFPGKSSRRLPSPPALNPYTKYGQQYWLTERTWILYKDFSRSLNMNPIFTLDMALLTMTLIVDHMNKTKDLDHTNGCECAKLRRRRSHIMAASACIWRATKGNYSQNYKWAAPGPQSRDATVRNPFNSPTLKQETEQGPLSRPHRCLRSPRPPLSGRPLKLQCMPPKASHKFTRSSNALRLPSMLSYDSYVRSYVHA